MANKKQWFQIVARVVDAEGVLHPNGEILQLEVGDDGLPVQKVYHDRIRDAKVSGSTDEADGLDEKGAKTKAGEIIAAAKVKAAEIEKAANDKAAETAKQAEEAANKVLLDAQKEADKITEAANKPK